MKKLFAIIVALTILAPLGVQAQSQIGSEVNQVESEHVENIISNQLYGPKSAKELEEFLDKFLEKEMKDQNIPGFMFSFVQDDEVVFNKDYGYSDVSAKKEVDPENDSFGVASVSKLFAATAIMQLVEDGKVDLDANAEDYLDGFKFENDFDKEITVRNLMLHTAGFEEYFADMNARKYEDALSLKDYIENYQPKVVYEPGDIYSYSNYSFTVMGYIVQVVSGQSFEAFVKENIFDPLEMEHSSFERQLPKNILVNLGKSYDYDDKAEEYEEIKRGYWNSYPGGALVTNTQDLGHFMIAQLNEGNYRDQSILNGDLVEMMQEKGYSPHEEILGQAFGFSLNKYNGHNIIEKSGSGSGWSAQLVLLPEYKQGFSLTFNSGNDAFKTDLLNALADEFYPDITERKDKVDLSDKDLEKYEGYYRYSRYNYSGLEKLLVGISPQYNATIKANDDGTISVGLMFVSKGVKYEPIGNNAFQIVAGEKPLEAGGMKIDFGERVAFREGDDGVDYFFSPYENIACKKISWFEYGMTQILFMLIFSLTSLLVVVWWSLGKLIKVLRKKKEEKVLKSQKIASWLGGTTAVMVLTFVGIMFTQFSDDIVFGVPMVIKVALILPILIILSSFGVIGFAIIAWKKSFWNMASRILYSGFAISLIVFVVWAFYFNLVGWNY